MNKFIYLSHILDSNVPTYGDEDGIEIKPKSEISKGETVNMFSLHMTNNHIEHMLIYPNIFLN